MQMHMGDFWVFGYGSLMWNPGFAHLEMTRARLTGYRRALCVRSFVHRGTPEQPGLVLGLARGGSCVGMAFRVAGENRDEVMTYLRERELVTHVYLERELNAVLADGRRTPVVTYICDRDHEQYAAEVHADEAAAIVNAARGKSGDNPAYVFSTIEHLKSLGIRDHWLEGVGDRLSAMSRGRTGE